MSNSFHRRVKFPQLGIAVNRASALSHVRRLYDRFVGSVLDGIDGWKDHRVTAIARFADNDAASETRRRSVDD